MSSGFSTFQYRHPVGQYLLCLLPSLENTQFVILSTLLDTLIGIPFVPSSSSPPAPTRNLCRDFTDTRDIFEPYPAILRRLAFVGRPASSIEIWTASESSRSLSLEGGFSRRQEQRGSVSEVERELYNKTSQEIELLTSDRSKLNNNINNNNEVFSSERGLLDLESLDLQIIHSEFQ